MFTPPRASLLPVKPFPYFNSVGSEYIYRVGHGMVFRTTRCIAKRETLLFEAEKEGVACSRRFLSETRTEVNEGDVVGILSLLDQVRQLQRNADEDEDGESSERNNRSCV